MPNASLLSKTRTSRRLSPACLVVIQGSHSKWFGGFFSSMALCWFFIVVVWLFVSFFILFSDRLLKRAGKGQEKSWGWQGTEDVVVGSGSSVEKWKPASSASLDYADQGVEWAIFPTFSFIWLKTRGDFPSEAVIWGMPEVVSRFAWVFLKASLSNTGNLMHYKRDWLVGWQGTTFPLKNHLVHY